MVDSSALVVVASWLEISRPLVVLAKRGERRSDGPDGLASTELDAAGAGEGAFSVSASDRFLAHRADRRGAETSVTIAEVDGSTGEVSFGSTA